MMYALYTYKGSVSGLKEDIALTMLENDPIRGVVPAPRDRCLHCNSKNVMLTGNHAYIECKDCGTMCDSLLETLESCSGCPEYPSEDNCKHCHLSD